MKQLLFILLFLAFGQNSKAQYIISGRIEGKDTIPFIVLPTVEIWGAITAEDLLAIQKYNRLKRNIIKVYPYAKWASAKFNEINARSQTMSSRERKRFIKDEEKKAKEQFAKDLKNFTYSQGKILIKLIDRETGQTSYELVKELRGSFQAFFWQSLARLFSANLKAEYDSVGEDRMIEQIVRGIERGEIK